MQKDSDIALLQDLIMQQHDYFSLLLSLVICQDEKIRLAVAEGILNILQSQSQTHPVSQILRQRLREFRDDILADPLPELVAAMSVPPVRPVP